MKEQTGKWFSFADEDIRVAKAIIEEGIYNQVCFHSQQAVEKSFKALIEEKGSIPKEHRLTKLLQICKDFKYEIEMYRDKVEFLDKFYTSTRYPFILGMLADGMPSKEDAICSLSYAEEIYAFAVSQLWHV